MMFAMMNSIWSNRVMKLISHLKPLSASERQAMASACDTTLGHLKNVGYGYRPCAAALAVRIEQYTAGQVSRRDLCPDDWRAIWPELADVTATPTQPAATPHQAVQPAGAVHADLQGVA